METETCLLHIIPPTLSLYSYIWLLKHFGSKYCHVSSMKMSCKYASEDNEETLSNYLKRTKIKQI